MASLAQINARATLKGLDELLRYDRSEFSEREQLELQVARAALARVEAGWPKPEGAA